MLFDNCGDPYQTTNLCDKPEHASLQQELDARLQAKLRQCNDDFRPAEEYIRQWGHKTDKSGTVPYTE